MAVHAFAPLVLMESDEEKKRLSPRSDPESELTAIAASSKRRRWGRQPSSTLDWEMDALLDSHAEQLKAGVMEIHRRQCEFLVAAAQTRVREWEAQAERLWIENAGLQARLQAASLQNQQLFAVARRSEATAAAFRGMLEAAVRESEAAALEREEFGDSGEVAADAISCCGGLAAAADGLRYRCQACGEREVEVLVMPCKHLCLCVVCEPAACDCPSCREPKLGIVHVISARGKQAQLRERRLSAAIFQKEMRLSTFMAIPSHNHL